MALESLKDCNGDANIWINYAKNEMFTAFLAASNSVAYTMMGAIRRMFTADISITRYKKEDVESQLAGILALIQIMNDNSIISSERIMELVPKEYAKLEDMLNTNIYSEQEKLRRYREQNGEEI